MRRILLASLAVALAGAATIGRWPEKTSEFQLSNGLRVVVLERSSSSTVSITLMAKAGWSDDPVGLRGLSAIMHRMIPEGGFAFGSKTPLERKTFTEAEELADKWEAELRKPKPDELDAARLRIDAEQAAGRVASMSEKAFFRTQLEKAGGGFVRSNADATFTWITAEMPAGAADVWFIGMGAWLKDPAWRQFYAHRNTAANAARQSDEQTALLNALAAKAYPDHAWAQPPVLLEELQKVRIRDMARFHKTAFAPGNLIVAISGNLSAAAARALAEKHFGDLPAQPAMTHDWARPGQTGFQLPLARPGTQVLAVGFKRPALDSPDDAVLDTLTEYLVSGPDSFLQKKLVRPLRAATFGGYLSHPSSTGGGLLCLVSTPVPGVSFADLEKDIQAALDELAARPIDAAALLPAKRRFLRDSVRLLENDDSATEFLARSVAGYGGTAGISKLFNQLEAITPADVQRAAAQYLKAGQRVSITWAGEQR
jgi:predicted Zn-dependent peptidase